LGESRKEEDFTLIERAKTKARAGQQRRSDPIRTIFHRVGQSQEESVRGRVKIDHKSAFERRVVAG